MKKISKLFFTVILCLSLTLSAFTPVFAASKGKKVTATVVYNAVTLSWQKTNGVQSYEVQQYVKNKKTWKKVASTQKAKYTVKNLKTGTTYKFRVVGVKKNGSTVVYNQVSAKPVCAAPKNVKATALTPTTARLTWKKVAGASSYCIQKKSGKKWVNIGTVKKGKLKFTVTGLLPGTTTRLRVFAQTKVGKKNVAGAYSKAVKIKTSIPTPTASFSGATVNSVSLSWSKVADATDYVVYKVDGSNYVQLLTAKTNSASVTGLKANTVYKFAVKARVGTKLSAYSAVVSAKTAPLAVTSLSATAEKSGSITLRWSDNQKADKYEIYQVKNGKTTLIGTAAKGATEYTVVGLDDMTTYAFKVKAVNVYGGKTLSGELSSEARATTIAAGVKDLKIDSQTENSITVSWKAANGATNFTLETSTDKINWTKAADLTSTDSTRLVYTVDGLSNTGLYFRVVATVGAAQIVSGEVFGRTLPGKVGTVTATVNGDSSATLSWAAIPGAEGYIVKNTATGKTAETKTNSYTVKSLADNAEYSFTVSAFVTANATKYTGKSSPVCSFKTAKCDAVENLRSSKRVEFVDGVYTVTGTILWTPNYDVEFVAEKQNPAVGKTWSSIGKTSGNSLDVSTDLKAKQSKKSDYVTTVSWTAVPGVKEYTVEYTVVPNSISFSDKVTTKNTSIDLRLAPSTEYTVVVSAVAEKMNYRVKATDPNKALLDSAYTTIEVKNAVIATSSVHFTTPNAAFVASNSESQQAYALKLIQGINNTKFENSAVTVRNVSKLDAEISAIELKQKILGKWTTMKFKNVDTLLSFVGMSDEDLTESLGENYDRTVKFNNGYGTYQEKYTDANGNEQVRTRVAYLSSFVTPSSGLAYLYDQNNNAAFKKGISSVSVSGNNITVKINKETQSDTSNANYHPGFVDSITSSLGEISGDDETTASATIGASTISGSVNAAGTLDSLNISSPYSMSMGMKISDDMYISFIVSGTVSNSYTFTR